MKYAVEQGQADLPVDVHASLYIFAAVSTGGFAPHHGSLATSGWPEQVWITLLCLAGAIPLAFYYRRFKEKRRVAVDFLQLSAGMAWPHVFHHAPLLAFSAQTSAGFSSMPCG
jgi:trk system potassium uptake protein TrkH